MRVLLVCPAPPRSRMGNRITAVRWQRILRSLGHRVRIAERLDDAPCDVVVALHARRSADAVAASRARSPERPVIVALTGTDLYRDIHTSEEARASLDAADALIVLQEHGALDLPRAVRRKTWVVPQSAVAPAPRPRRRPDAFEVAVVGHLRPEKDPFRAAEAARLLPASSRIAILHAGAALSAEMRDRAEAEARDNPRYTWLGELSPKRARELIARCRLLVLTSIMEGGANVLSEAIVSRTPIVASRIPCTIGMLGAGYPGFFRVGDTAALARKLARVEARPAERRALTRACDARRRLFSPAHEARQWARLLASLAPRAG